MKIKSLLIGMLACTALVGCSNEDEPVVNNGNQVNGDAKAYMKVQLVMNDVSGSRATDGGYADGEKKEQAITSDNSIFLFYDAAGNYITFGKVVGGNATEDGHTNNIDIHYPAYIALSGPDESIKNIKQVLTVVNYGADECKALQNINLTAALGKTSEATIAGTEGTFLMTTAVYLENAVNAGNDVDGDKISNTTKISDGDFYDDQAEAMTAGNPVVIHIERAAAKVQVIANTEAYDVKDNADETLNEDAGDIHVDGVLNKIQIKVNGWKLNNINPTTKIMKDITDWTTTAPFDGWNITWTSGSDTYGRSFWSKGTKWDYAGLATLAKDATHTHELTAYTYAQATTATTTATELTKGYEYCWEQTVGTALAARGTAYPNVTTVLIAAQVVLADGTSPDLYKNNGVYYTVSTYKKLILQQLMDAGYAKTVDENDNVTAYFDENDLTFSTVDGSLAGFKVTVSTAGQLKGTDGAYAEATVNDINAAITQLPCVDGAIGYKEGKCFYQIPIEHLSSIANEAVKPTVPEYGVVRNHWYQLTISGIKHIGEAVYNPEVVIPQIPPQNTEYYMAAELHVLSWKVVSQQVELD